ncbi:tyrosine-type recombinase/integrase [Ekhidna sp.]|uniref:tyrosine-type recombinase/integrase n=1 Tax=Ekhidna sp. TaxID=2608089 RepID=UPI0032EBB23F
MKDTLKLTNDTPKYPYRLGHIADRGGDLSKRWYVTFYVYDIAKGELMRKMAYGNINKKKSRVGRMAEARKLKQKIDNLLLSGHVTNSNIKEPPKPQPHKNRSFTIGTALKYALEIKKNEVKPSSYKEYKVALGMVEKFLRYTGDWGLPLERFTYEVGDSIFEYLKGEYVSPYTGDPLSNTSINNYRTFLRNLINVLRRKELLKIDPTARVSKQKAKVKFHEVYADDEIERIKNYLIEQDPHLWLLCQFVYYCFVRPGREARKLKIKHLRADNRLIIPSDVGKTDLRYPIIPEALQMAINDWKLRDYSPEYYIFAQGGKPGADMCYRNYWTNRYRRVREKLKFKPEQTLYSWKHTGACKLYQVVKDPYVIMQQCGHTTIETTMKYLRQLGQFSDNRLDFPGI